MLLQALIPKTKVITAFLAKDLLIKLWGAPLLTRIDTIKAALLQPYIYTGNASS